MHNLECLYQFVTSNIAFVSKRTQNAENSDRRKRLKRADHSQFYLDKFALIIFLKWQVCPYIKKPFLSFSLLTLLSTTLADEIPLPFASHLSFEIWRFPIFLSQSLLRQTSPSHFISLNQSLFLSLCPSHFCFSNLIFIGGLGLVIWGFRASYWWLLRTCSIVGCGLGFDVYAILFSSGMSFLFCCKPLFQQKMSKAEMERWAN